MLRLIGNPELRDSDTSRLSGQSNSMQIYDARPYLSAVANKVHGKGFENTSHYKNVEIRFMDIENIHAVRDSYKKLTTAIRE